MIFGRYISVCCGAFILCYSALAGTLYIAPDGVGSGASWNDPASISALTSAAAGTHCWLKEGTYSPEATISLSSGISLYGGFSGDEESVETRSGGESEISGDGRIQVMKAVIAEGETLLLDRVTISKGSSTTVEGVGLNKTGKGNLTLVDCTLREHKGSKRGDALYAQDGIVSITGTLFSKNIQGTRNMAGQNGFAFQVYSAQLIVRDCDFKEHSSVTDGSGSVLYVRNCQNSEITGCRFLDNAAPSKGSGGLGGTIWYSEDCSGSVFRNCLISGTTSKSPNQGGVGVRCSMSKSTGTLLIENCTFAGNSAIDMTAGNIQACVYAQKGAVSVRNCIFSANSLPSGRLGSAIYRDVSTDNSVQVSNCCFDSVGTDSLVDSTGGQDFLMADCFASDPLFADLEARDFHLKSSAGRFSKDSWVLDESDSPCIDAGSVDSPYDSEPSPNGGRCNIGYYANTAEASKSMFNLSSSVSIRSLPCVTDEDRTRIRFRASLDSADANGAATVRLCYGLSDGGEDETAWDFVIPMTGNKRVGEVFGYLTEVLSPNTTYSYRWHTVNSSTDVWTGCLSVTSSDSLGVGGGIHVIHVNPAATGHNDGYDWDDAFTSLGDAMSALSTTRSEIWIAEGTNTVSGLMTASMGFTLRGGFVGTERSPEERTSRLVTVLDANYKTQVFNFTVPLGQEVVLDHIVVYRSNVPGVEKSGAGSFIVEDCAVRNFKGGNFTGFGMKVRGGTAVFRCTEFSGMRVSSRSTTGADGMGLYVESAALRIEECRFFDNRQTAANGVMRGGALSINNCQSACVSKSMFVDNEMNNSENSKGGATVAVLGDCGGSVFRNCLIVTNAHKVTSTYAVGACWGAGVYVSLKSDSATVSFENCTIADNVNMGGSGGAFHIVKGAVSVKNSICYGNTVGEGFSGDVAYVSSSSGSIAFSYCNLDSFSDEVLADGSASSPSRVSVAQDTCIITDPLFVGGGSYHLQSRHGYLNELTGIVERSLVYSPAIDSGEPTSDYSNEPAPNGKRVNLGYYGNTRYASLSQKSGLLVVFR